MVSIDDAAGSVHPHKCLESTPASPIARLPVETLQHIFVHSILSMPQLGFQGVDHSDMPVLPFSEPNLAQPPLLLTRVCTSWRAISISTPELWSSVRVSIRGRSHYRGRGELLRPMLEAWLRNAQIQPLNIVLDNPGYQFSAIPPPGSLWDYILPVFMSHASHWSTLIASPGIAEYLLERKVHMPMLKTFSSQKLASTRSVDILRLVPKLSSLSVAILDDKWLLPEGVAQGLQHLSLLMCDTALDVLTILAYFPRLLSFQLRTCWNDELRGTTTTRLVVHRTLEQFVIPCTVVLPCVRDMLSLPSLRTMTVTGMWGATQMQSVGLMLSRSSCSLEYLEFSGSIHDIDIEIWYEVERLFLFSPHIRVYHVDFERPSSLSLGWS